MKKITRYQNQKVFVLGLARSGMAAAKLLHQLGAFVTVNDGKSFEENPEAQELLDLGIKVVTGSHPVELLDEDFYCMVKNPGIPYSNPMVEKALAKKMPIITDIELAYEISEAPIVAITGTNGKTTTTTMIGEILNAGRQNGQAYLAGNIGIPASEVAEKATKEDVIVMETSSFQLMGTTEFHPEIAVVTNVYSTHLDYHGSQAAYEEAKWQIQKNLTPENYLILNGNQEKLVAWAEKTKASVLRFATTKEEKGAFLKEGTLYVAGKPLMKADELGVPGSHNVENALAAALVANLFQIDFGIIADTLRHFHGVPHRTQYVATIAGRKFFNDSKATNSLATKKALSGFAPEKTILIAGGLDRGNSLDDLIPNFKNLKAVITFGQTSEKLQEVAKKAGVKQIVETKDPVSAVPLAYEISEKDDIILLSPANASWDQYPNFETRGEAFMGAVKKLQKEVQA